MKPEQVCHFLWDLDYFTFDDGDKSQLTRTFEGLRYASLAIAVITCILGLVGNSLVILVSGFKMKKVKTMTWFLNLAVADLIFLICLPMSAIALFKDQWYFEEFFCKVYHFLSNLNMYASIFILTALSIDRCLSVAQPLWHRHFVSHNLVHWVCLMLWLFTITISIPGFVFSHVQTIHNKRHCSLGFYRSNQFDASKIFINSSACEKTYIPRTNKQSYIQGIWLLLKYGNMKYVPKDFPLHREECQHNFSQFFETCIDKVQLDHWNTMVSDAYLLITPLLIGGFLIPLVIIILANIIIAFQAKRSKSKVSPKLYKLIVAMVALFFCSWTPLAVVETLFLKAIRNMDFHLLYSIDTVLPLVSSIASFHSCLNPILYVLLSKRVKKKLTESFGNVWIGVNTRPTSTTQCTR